MKPELVLAALALAGLAASAALWALVRTDGGVEAVPVADIRGDPIGAPLGEPVDGAPPAAPTSASLPGAAEAPGLASDGEFASDAELASSPAADANSAPADATVLDRSSAGGERSEGAALAPLELAPSALHHAREGARRREERGAVGERDEEGVLVVQFDELELVAYEPPDPEATDAEREARGEVLPALLRDLDGETISIRGYMSPLEFEDDRVTSFVLSRNLPGCCFGVLPQPDEWVEVDVLMKGGVDYLPFGSVVVTGRLEVGEEFDEYGYVTSVYRLQAESVEEPW